MPLSSYHQKYIERSDRDIKKRAQEKGQELELVFKKAPIPLISTNPRVAVLGCADKRLVPHHKRIFEELLGKPVRLITFDITTKHLQGGVPLERWRESFRKGEIAFVEVPLPYGSVLVVYKP
jgi:hypothetical protein